MTKERNNPWAGLASYEDPAKSERKLKFCGRDNDIYDVTRLIDDNLLLILYGKSGIGKTSLLNAGVFPELRKEQYLPVSIRLGTLEVSASYQEAIVYAIEKAIEEAHGSITVYHVVEEQTDDHLPDLLWNYFARHRFANAEGQPLFPVVVLDQFEEVLRNTSPEHVEKAQTLLNQLQYLIDESHALNDCVVDGQDYFYDFNFRFIFSIREDELYLLEDNIDDLSLSMFRNCRYRLRSLSEQGATEAILLPGKDCIVEEQKQAVVDRVIELSKRPQSNDIDTLLLSLVCAGTYDKKAGEKIVLSDLAVWKNNPMEVYYQDAIKGLSANQVRYIQQNLILEDGSRKRVDANEVKTALGGITYNNLTYGENKMLVLGENGQVELLHDQIAQAIYEEKMQRKQKRIFFQRFITNGIFDGVVLAFDLFIVLFMMVTQNTLNVRVFYSIIGAVLLMSTYMQNVTRINNDKRVDAFILPQISACLIIYSGLKFGQIETMYAYHTIKPSLFYSLLDIFLCLNIVLSVISIVTRVSGNIETNTPRWENYFSLKQKSNRFAQVSLLSSIIISICVFVFTPDTRPEKLRKLANKGDYNAMIELGDYYMKYDRNVVKAREWYNAAAKDTIVDELISKTYDVTLIEVTDSMKIEAVNAFLHDTSMTCRQQIYKINQLLKTDIIEPYDAYKISEFYDNEGNANATINWLSYVSQQYTYWNVGKAELGLQLWRGEYLEQDMVRAFELYLESKSHSNVVVCYLNGWGVKKSATNALDYIIEHDCLNEISPSLILTLRLQSWLEHNNRTLQQRVNRIKSL